MGGTLGDLNQVLLENEALHFRHMKETPEYSGQTFPAWRDELWQNLDTLRQGMAKRRGYTHRQQDFLRLLLEDCYVRTMMDYQGAIAWKMKLHNPDSTLARLKETYTLADPHAKDLLLYHDGRTFYLPLYPSRLPYLEANGLDHGEVYEMMKGFNAYDDLSMAYFLRKNNQEAIDEYNALMGTDCKTIEEGVQHGFVTFMTM